MPHVKENPEYLRNRSRSLHASYRRNRRFTNIFLALFTIFLVGRAAIVLADRFASLGLGYQWADVWTSLEFLAFVVVFWLFANLIQKTTLAYIRHTYGAEPVIEKSDRE